MIVHPEIDRTAHSETNRPAIDSGTGHGKIDTPSANNRFPLPLSSLKITFAPIDAEDNTRSAPARCSVRTFRSALHRTMICACGLNRLKKIVSEMLVSSS